MGNAKIDPVITQVVNQKNLKASGRGSKSKVGADVALPSPSTVRKQMERSGPPCVGCGVVVGADVRALQCDQCCAADSVWKCADCLGIGNDLYGLLMAGAGAELQWICDTCKNRNGKLRDGDIDDRTGKLAEQLEKVLSRMSTFDEMMRQSRSEMLQWQAKIEELVSKRSDTVSDAVQSIEVLRSDVEVQLQEFRKQDKLDVMKVKDCVQQAIDVRSQEEKEEEAERLKRKTSIIIHGLAESTEELAADRHDDDINQVAAVFSELDCNEAKIEKLFRLGRRSGVEQSGDDVASTAVRSRPLKVVLNSEEQKIQILVRAKNLRKKEDTWAKIYIHQDLTLKEREHRNVLLEQIRERKKEGETDLIIVKGKIVRKFSSYQ